MAATDTNTMLLQLFQQMDEQRRADRKEAEEQRRVDQQAAEESNSEGCRSNDARTCWLLKSNDVQTSQAAEEQRRADQLAAEERALKAEEQRKAADERNRIDMLRMFHDMQGGFRSTSSRPSTDRFPSLKIDFKEFSGESEDWNAWSRVHYA